MDTKELKPLIAKYIETMISNNVLKVLLRIDVHTSKGKERPFIY